MLRPPSFAWSEAHRISVTTPRFHLPGPVFNPAFVERGKRPCGAWLYHNRKTGGIGVFRCQSWRCAYCGPRRKGRFVARVAQLLEGWDRVRFWTLTLKPDRIPPGLEPERHLLSAWRVLRAHLAQRCPRCNGRARGGPPRCKQHPDATIRAPSFVWVLEYTKAGIPHLHVAVNQYVPRPWLQSKWERLTGAWNVDLRELRDVQDGTWYLAKYLGKTLTVLEADGRGHERLRGVHIYGSSQDMQIWAPKAKTDWELVRDPAAVGALLVPYEEDVLLLQLHGFDPAVEMLGESPPAVATASGPPPETETAGPEEDPPKNGRETGSPLKHAEGPGPPGRGKVAYRGRCRSCGLRIFATDPWTVADLLAQHAREAHPT